MKTLSVDSFKNETRTILNEIENKGELICIADNRRMAVLVGLNQYRTFMRRLEDLEDALDLKEAIATSMSLRTF